MLDTTIYEKYQEEPIFPFLKMNFPRKKDRNQKEKELVNLLTKFYDSDNITEDMKNNLKDVKQQVTIDYFKWKVQSQQNCPFNIRYSEQ